MQDPLAFLGSTAVLDDREQAFQKIRLIIRIRWFISPTVLVLLLAASNIGLSARTAFSLNQLVVNGVNTLVILLLNGIYSLLVRRLANLKPLIYFQLFIDTLHFTLTIYKTGGASSPLTFLYFGVIFAGAVLVSGKASYLTALVIACLYSLMNLLEWFRVLPHQDYFIPLAGLQAVVSYLVLAWLFNLASFFVMAFLASLLTRAIRKRAIQVQETNRILDKKISTLLLLYRTAKALSSYTAVSEVVDYILSELLKFLDLDRALLYLNVNGEQLHLYMIKHKPRAETSVTRPEELKVDIPLQEGAGLTARAALTRQAFNIRHPEESELINRDLAQKIGMNPFALAPMIVRDTVVGVIGIDRSYKNGWISEEEFQILLIFANQAAITIQSLTKNGFSQEKAEPLRNRHPSAE